MIRVRLLLSMGIEGNLGSPYQWIRNQNEHYKRTELRGSLAELYRSLWRKIERGVGGGTDPYPMYVRVVYI